MKCATHQCSALVGRTRSRRACRRERLKENGRRAGRRKRLEGERAAHRSPGTNKAERGNDWSRATSLGVSGAAAPDCAGGCEASDPRIKAAEERRVGLRLLPLCAQTRPQAQLAGFAPSPNANERCAADFVCLANLEGVSGAAAPYCAGGREAAYPRIKAAAERRVGLRLLLHLRASPTASAACRACAVTQCKRKIRCSFVCPANLDGVSGAAAPNWNCQYRFSILAQGNLVT